MVCEESFKRYGLRNDTNPSAVHLEALRFVDDRLEYTR